MINFGLLGLRPAGHDWDDPIFTPPASRHAESPLLSCLGAKRYPRAVPGPVEPSSLPRARIRREPARPTVACFRLLSCINEGLDLRPPADQAEGQLGDLKGVGTGSGATNPAKIDIPIVRSHPLLPRR